METHNVPLTDKQLDDTLSGLTSLIHLLEVRLIDTHSGVDRLLIESVIINTKELLAHYEAHSPSKNAEPAEKSYDEVEA